MLNYSYGTHLNSDLAIISVCSCRLVDIRLPCVRVPICKKTEYYDIFKYNIIDT